MDRGIEASLHDPRRNLFDGSGRTYQNTPSSRCETVVSFADEAQAIANGFRRGSNSSSTFRDNKHTRRTIDDRQDRRRTQRRHFRGSQSQNFSPVSSSAAHKSLRIESASQVDRNHLNSSYPRDHQTRYSSFSRDQQPQGYRKSDAIGNSDIPRFVSGHKAHTSRSSIDDPRKNHPTHRDDNPYQSNSNSDASIRPDDSVSVRGDRFDMRAMDRDLPLLVPLLSQAVGLSLSLNLELWASKRRMVNYLSFGTCLNLDIRGPMWIRRIRGLIGIGKLCMLIRWLMITRMEDMK